MSPTTTDLSEPSVSGLDTNAVLMQQLSERAAHDPLAGLLLARLQSEDTGPQPDRLDELQRRFDVLLRANRQLQEALVAADRMTTWVAQLVGACPRCWGLLPGCPACAGLGRPGRDLPDVDELVDWLGPALRRAGLRLTRSGALRPRLPHDADHHTEQEKPWQ